MFYLKDGDQRDEQRRWPTGVAICVGGHLQVISQKTLLTRRKVSVSVGHELEELVLVHVTVLVGVRAGNQALQGERVDVERGLEVHGLPHVQRGHPFDERASIDATVVDTIRVVQALENLNNNNVYDYLNYKKSEISFTINDAININ